MILSTEILNFNVRFENSVEYFIANRERFGYTDLQMETLDRLWQEWKIVFKKYTHPRTHGGLSTDAINMCYDLSYPLLTSMKQKAKSPLIKLSALDNAFLELNTNTKTVGKTPVTDYAPNLACLENNKASCKFFAMDPKHLGTKRKPQGADKIGIMVAYTVVGASEPDKEAYKKIKPSKKSIFELLITPDKAGMVLHIKVYYISPTGEDGKPSASVMVKLAL